MKSTLLIILGLAAAFFLGKYVSSPAPQPLVNETVATPLPSGAVAKPPGTSEADKLRAAEMHRRIAESGPRVPVPNPTAEEMQASATGKQLENRNFKQLTPEQANILTQALARLQDPNVSKEDAMKMLELAAANYGSQILEIAAAAIKHPAEDVRIRALKLLQRNGDPGILDVAQTALKDPEPNVRLSAIAALDQQRGPMVTQVFKQTLKDPNNDVVMGAIHYGSNLPPVMAADVLGEAVSVSPKDPAIYALNCLSGMQNKEAVPAIMKGLNSADEEIKVNAEHAFMTVAGEFPDNPQQWWAENQSNYDDNMVPIIDGQPNEPIPTDILPGLPSFPTPVIPVTPPPTPDSNKGN